MRNLSTIYPGKTTVDANNPDGTFKNEVTPGVSDDGTPLEEQWQQDVWGFFAHILNKVSVAPDGVQENEATSQIYDGLETAAKTLWTSALTARGTNYNFKRCVLSNAADADHDITFGECTFGFIDGTGNAYSAGLTKQIDAAWAAGTNAGGLPVALSPANNTVYHCYALSNATGTVTDFGFDTSITAATLIADAAVIAALGAGAKYRRQGSIITDGSANILGFIQIEKSFYLTTEFTSLNTSITGGAAATTFAVKVPTEISAIALLNGHCNISSGATIATAKVRVFPAASGFTDDAATLYNSQMVCQRDAANFNSAGASAFDVLADDPTSMRISASAGGGTVDVDIGTRGWRDVQLEY